MKAIFKDVLFVAPEQREYQGKTYYKAVIVDDKGAYDRIEVSVDMQDLSGLPQPRSRVDVSVDVVQRQNKVYLQNPVFTVTKPA